MTGIQALTEKEKETLRLLVDGHDAKSMARHLGLSVHTINERLRDARRKMSASSSREAARQLREIEGRHPEILRDKALGEAAAAPGMEEMTASAGTRRMERSSGWIAGGLFMSFSLALPAFVSMSGSADTPVAAPSTVPAESPAVAAARDWLAKVDNGARKARREAKGQSVNEHNQAAPTNRVGP